MEQASVDCELYISVCLYFYCEILENAVTGSWLEGARGTLWSPACVTAVTGGFPMVKADIWGKAPHFWGLVCIFFSPSKGNVGVLPMQQEDGENHVISLIPCLLLSEGKPMSGYLIT